MIGFTGLAKYCFCFVLRAGAASRIAPKAAYRLVVRAM